MKHCLKVWTEYFGDLVDGTKRFEVRKMDRPFKLGDTLILQEWDPVSEEYTEDEIERRICYILQGGQFGIESGYCVLGLEGWM